MKRNTSRHNPPNSTAKTAIATAAEQDRVKATPQQPAKHLPKATKIVLGVIGAAVAGLLAITIGLSGGIAGVISGLKSAPDPKSPQLTQRRSAAQQAIQAELDQIQQSAGLTPAAAATYDTCYQGQNNWKVHDGYAYRCDYRVTRYYGFNGDFGQKMLGLEQQLYNANWQAANGERSQLGYIIQNYYNKLYGSTLQTGQNAGSRYTVSNLPTVVGGYAKDGISIDISYGEKASKDAFWIESAQHGMSAYGFTTFQDKSPIDIDATIAQITRDNTYLLAVSLQQHYFSN